jgi:hypothetical protein
MSDDIVLAITKLSPRRGDLIIITVPDTWNGAEVQAFECGRQREFGGVLNGAIVMVIPEQSRILVRHRPDPQGAANLVRLIAPSAAVN